jgi:hypothetical protein
MQKVEILCALKKLGEKLSEDEESFVKTNINNNMKQFEIASTNIGIIINHIQLINFKIQNKNKQTNEIEIEIEIEIE